MSKRSEPARTLTMHDGQFTEEEKSRLCAIELEKWVVLVNRFFNAMNVELTMLESRQAAQLAEQNKKTSDPNTSAAEPTLDPSHTRHLIAITQAMTRVRVINEAIVDEEKAKRSFEALRKAESAGQELDRRLAKLAAKRRP